MMDRRPVGALGVILIGLQHSGSTGGRAWDVGIDLAASGDQNNNAKLLVFGGRRRRAPRTTKTTTVTVTATAAATTSLASGLNCECCVEQAD